MIKFEQLGPTTQEQLLFRQYSCPIFLSQASSGEEVIVMVKKKVYLLTFWSLSWIVCLINVVSVKALFIGAILL